MRVWEVAAAVLADAGVTHVFGLPADEPALLDAADAHPALTCVPVRDQRVGACAAAGFTAASGVPSVLALTSGPAFTNALTGLLEAASLGLPLVVVTTRVPAGELGRGAFQEVDQKSMAGPLVKWFCRVERGDRLIWALRRAVHLALNGRPGITMVEVTDEVQRAEPPAYAGGSRVRRLRAIPTSADLTRAARVLAAAERPMIVAGGGARLAGAGAAVTELARVCDAPVFTTASGRGVVDEDLPVACGLVGLYLTPPLDELVEDADVVCVVGSRLEETARMGWSSLQHQRIIHVDVDSDTFGQAAPAEVELLGDAALTLVALARRVAAEAAPDRSAWRERVTKLRDAALETPGDSPVRATLRALDEVFGPRMTLVQENGLHDIWGYHFSALRVRAGTVLVGPGEQTMMGFGVPAAIGAALARPDRPTVVVCGDGALGISVNALPTIAELGLGIVVVAFDNGGFGWPRRGRLGADAPDRLTRFQRPSPVDALVAALDGVGYTVDHPGRLTEAFTAARAAAEAGRIALVTVPVTDDDVPIGVLRIEELP